MCCLVACLFPLGHCWQLRPKLSCSFSPYKEKDERNNLEGHQLVQGKDENIGQLLNTLLCSDDKCPDTTADRQSHPPSSIRAGWCSRKNKLCFWRAFSPAKDRSFFREALSSCFPSGASHSKAGSWYQGFPWQKKSLQLLLVSSSSPCPPLPCTHNNWGLVEGLSGER